MVRVRVGGELEVAPHRVGFGEPLPEEGADHAGLVLDRTQGDAHAGDLHVLGRLAVIVIRPRLDRRAVGARVTELGKEDGAIRTRGEGA